MHEMSIAEGILDIVEDTARREGASRVRAIRLEIGALAGVEVEALEFCLAVVLEGSIAAGASLEVERTPGRGWCLDCAEAVGIAALDAPCPRCAGYRVQATGGTEMRVKDLLVQ